MRLVPARERGVEILDDPAVDPAVRERSIADVTRSNWWLGGLRAARLVAAEAIREGPRHGMLLDIGTGLADIPTAVRRDAERGGVRLSTIGVDRAVSLLATARARGGLNHAVAADALALPFRTGSIDVVTCSQVLHHFEEGDVERLLAEMDRVARHAAVVSDLRRSWVAVVGFWAVSFILRFHRVTRHDGMVSVMRGFTANELSDLIRRVAGVAPVVSRRLGFRVTARWSPRDTG